MDVCNSDFNGMEGSRPPFVTRSRYLLLFILSDEEEMEIVRLKKIVRQRYGMVPKVDSRPHITIFLMVAHPNLVSKIEEIVRGFSGEIRAQAVRLTDVRVFPSNRTAYVDVKEQEYLRTLSQRIAEKVKRTLPDVVIEPKSLSSHPHVTIAALPSKVVDEFLDLTKGFNLSNYSDDSCIRAIVLYDQMGRRSVWKIEL